MVQKYEQKGKQMALNVLLVDDEYIVLKGLEIMLQNQNEVSLQITTSMDAVEALEQLKNGMPDVIIADINMPEVDGLTMLEQIAAGNEECRFIIVSGYEEQEYLKRALKLHVTDYLTKPVDKAYLIKRLKQLDEEKRTRNSLSLLKMRLLIFSGDRSAMLSPQELESLFPAPRLALCAAPLSSSQAEIYQPLFSSYFGSCFPFTQNNWTVFLLNYAVRIPQQEVRKLLRDLLDDIPCGFAFYSGRTLLGKELSKSKEITSFSHLYYQQALSELVLSVLPVSDHVKSVIAEHISRRSLSHAVSLLMLEKSVSSYLSDICADESNIKLNFQQAFVESLAAYILISGINLSRETILQFYQLQEKNVFDKRTLLVFLEKTLNFWYDSITPSEHDNYSAKILSACQYIQQHYREDLSLEELSEKISINSSYLSYIFKKETGDTFLHYLTDVRMKNACELMICHPELSLEEIACQTGYHSASYFHKIFRNKYGMSPRQWMQANQKQ